VQDFANVKSHLDSPPEREKFEDWAESEGMRAFGFTVKKPVEQAKIEMLVGLLSPLAYLCIPIDNCLIVLPN